MKIKEIWQKHKAEIILGGAFAASTTLVVVLLSKGLPKIKMAEKATDIFEWTFDNLDEAVAKFKEMEMVCNNLGTGEAVLFGGAGNLPEGCTNAYTVMYL